MLTEIGEGANDTLGVTGTVPTARGARTGARDSSSGKIYLPTAQFQPAQAHERPVAKSGSFHILVLSPV